MDGGSEGGSWRPGAFGWFGLQAPATQRWPSLAVALLPEPLGPLLVEGRAGLSRFAPLSGHRGRLLPTDHGYLAARGAGLLDASAREAVTRGDARLQLSAPLLLGRTVALAPFVRGALVGYGFDAGRPPVAAAWGVAGLEASAELAREYGAAEHVISPRLAPPGRHRTGMVPPRRSGAGLRPLGSADGGRRRDCPGADPLSRTRGGLCPAAGLGREPAGRRSGAGSSGSSLDRTWTCGAGGWRRASPRSPGRGGGSPHPPRPGCCSAAAGRMWWPRTVGPGWTASPSSTSGRPPATGAATRSPPRSTPPAPGRSGRKGRGWTPSSTSAATASPRTPPAPSGPGWCWAALRSTIGSSWLPAISPA